MSQSNDDWVFHYCGNQILNLAFQVKIRKWPLTNNWSSEGKCLSWYPWKHTHDMAKHKNEKKGSVKSIFLIIILTLNVHICLCVMCVKGLQQCLKAYMYIFTLLIPLHIMNFFSSIYNGAHLPVVWRTLCLRIKLCCMMLLFEQHKLWNVCSTGFSSPSGGLTNKWR